MKVKSGIASIRLSFVSSLSAKYSATKLPVTAAVLVPPSAWSTSQSMCILISPIDVKSNEDLRALPINRCISLVRPLCRLLRGILWFVEPGNMLYSAVIQPLLLPLKNVGTVSLMFAVQSTLVLPVEIRADPLEKSK